jgi:hypothetical protein
MDKYNYFDNSMLSSAIRMAQNIQNIKQAYIPIQNISIPSPEVLEMYRRAVDALPPNYNELMIQAQRTAKFCDTLKFNNIGYMNDESFLKTYYKIISATKPLIKTVEWSKKYIENNLLIKSLNSLNLSETQLSIDLKRINYDELNVLIGENNLLDINEYEEDLGATRCNMKSIA